MSEHLKVVLIRATMDLAIFITGFVGYQSDKVRVHELGKIFLSAGLLGLVLLQ